MSWDGFHALPDPVLILDTSGRVHFLNYAAEQWLGISQKMALKADIARFLTLPPAVQTALRELPELGGSARFYDVPLTPPRGSAQHVALYLGPNLGPMAEHIVLWIRPLTIAESYAAGHQEERVQAAATMAAMLAHEIKNPLSGIRGAAQLLEQDADAAAQGLTQLICREVDRIRGLLDSFDVLGEQPLAAPERVNIHEVLEHVRAVASAGFAAHVRCVLQYDPSLPDVWGNRDALVQIVLNLVKNAAEATERQNDAEITLITAPHYGVRLRRSGAPHFQRLPVSVVVQDNGPGIPAELKNHLFEPFISGKAGGKGLGLAIASKRAAEYGGVLQLEESRAGHTRFRLLLPAAATQP